MIKFDDEKQNKQLDELRKQEEEDVVELLAEARYGIPPIDLTKVVIENEALRGVDEKEAHDAEAAPFKVTGKNIHIAVHSPLKPETVLLKENLESKGFIPHFYMASMASLKKVWDRYRELSFSSQSRAGGLDIDSDILVSIGAKVKMIADVKGVVDEMLATSTTHKISRELEIILGGAIALNASDIHIEPEEKVIRLRLRLDGVLQNTLELSAETYKQINSRIKLLSGMKLTSKSAQDGRFSIFLGDSEISIRTSMIPGAYGESIVMRILNPKSIQVDLEDIGIEPHLFEIINSEIEKPNGLILLTGPTGSGKTTTLYAFMRRIYSTEIKIITIEDPIEYHLGGITQTQTNDEKGYTFLEGLRSALRQDPDVIMVGEIRDGETAKIAIESALTGHLVFSTLHTNNAAGVIPRLIDLGVNPKIIPSALSLSIAQRLVRKLCIECKKEKEFTEDERKIIMRHLTAIKAMGKDLTSYKVDENNLKMFGAVGCTACNMTGYKGRMGIFEAIRGDDVIEKIIPENPSEHEIMKAARAQKILTMQEDGVIKILNGVTSMDEVQKVVDIEEVLE